MGTENKIFDAVEKNFSGTKLEFQSADEGDAVIHLTHAFQWNVFCHLWTSGKMQNSVAQFEWN